MFAGAALAFLVWGLVPQGLEGLDAHAAVKKILSGWDYLHSCENHLVSVDPFILEVLDVITSDEAENLIRYALSRLKPSTTTTTTATVTANGMSKSTATSYGANFGRTSWSAIVANNDTELVPVALKLQQLGANLTGTKPCYVEDIQVVRYQPGQYFLPHYDWFSEPEEHSSGQRLWTMFVYLNTPNLHLELDCNPTTHPKCTP